MNMSGAVISRSEKVAVDFVLSVEAANVSVVDLMCCVVVDVMHGCCVVCSPCVSSLVVNCAEFCVCADVHCVCVRANLLVLFQRAVVAVAVVAVGRMSVLGDKTAEAGSAW